MMELYDLLISKFNMTLRPPVILIDVNLQTLSLINHNGVISCWPVSTAKAGIGNQKNSYQTPTGAHEIGEKIGHNEPLGMIFDARKPTGQVAELLHAPRSSGQDQITSRILWLKGVDPTINLGGNVDTYERFIYIHGTAEEGLIGQAVSHGCIRMCNADVIELFDLVDNGSLVYICESQSTLELV
ncbi:MAG: L,D-transpeptidase [Gammaproteobacteria bacterium]|nr:L,D-transpeptidase [Gammaproteobacteria bacterium]